MAGNSKFDAEKYLLETLERIAKKRSEYKVLYVNISKLKPKNRHPKFVKIITRLFDDLVSIANGLQVNPQNRTKNVDAFRNELVYGETKENIRRAATVRAAEQKAKQEPTEPTKKGSGIKYAAISAGVTAAVLLAIGLILLIVNWSNIFGNGLDFINSDHKLESNGPAIGDFESGAEISTVL